MEPGIKKVVVAMSGGVDSAVAAARLLAQGYDIEGVSLRMWEENRGERVCSDYSGAENLARQLGISHTLLDLRGQFREMVVRPLPMITCGAARQIHASRATVTSSSARCSRGRASAVRITLPPGTTPGLRGIGTVRPYPCFAVSIAPRINRIFSSACPVSSSTIRFFRLAICTRRMSATRPGGSNSR